MTPRELIKELEGLDDDVLDNQISIIITKQWNQTKIELEGLLTEVDENTDFLGRLVLRAS